MFDFKRFRKDNKLTQKQLAELLGCTNTNISMAEVNNKDLTEGQLEILLNLYGDKVRNYILSDKLPINRDSESLLFVPLVPLSALAGKLTGFSLEGVRRQDCEFITSPIEGADFAVPVTGDSMAPEYPSGSRVLVQKVNPNSFIEWGKVYVLDTCNGIVIKQLRKSNKDGYVSCFSINDNSIYAPFDISLADIHGIYRVLLCLALK
jgi:phage repressor protein C with HTH and peptisase S24 domain